MDLETWIRSYATAWETSDDALVGELFSDDATYRSSPFRQPLRGRAEIRRYWREATGGLEEAQVRMGRPVVDGDRVAVEWWAMIRSEGEEVTLPGCLLLQFADEGRCAELREYWNLEKGRREPFSDWGS